MPSDSQELATLLDLGSLRRLAGARSYERGVAYHNQGRVLSPAEYGGAVAAKVRGTQDYAVKLWIEDNYVQHSCSCPMGEDGSFCKHCVAVALTLVESKRSAASAGVQKTTVTMDDVRAHLARQDSKVLVELLMRQALEHPDLRRRLLMETARQRPEGLDLGPFYAAIDEAVVVNGFVPYREAHAYVAGINRVVSSLRELLTKEYASRAIEVIEYAISKVEKAMESVDDSDGDMGSVLCDLQQLHHEACVLAKPDPTALADRLFRWEIASDWEVFLDAADAYNDVLGSTGAARYRELAEDKWKKVAPLAPGQDDENKYGTRWRITRMMDGFARRAGDIAALIEVMARDLSTAYDFLQIAEVCKKARRREEAVKWAERGVAAFPRDTDWRLREFLAEEYHRLRRPDEAMNLIWAEFSEHPNIGLYQELKRHADRCKQWSSWREKALACVREEIAKAKAEANSRRPSWFASAADSSTLVEILLWEKDVEGAWQEAQAGGCDDRLWRQLAEKREQDHTEDSLRVIQAAVEPTIAQMSNDAYKEAVNLLHKVWGIMARLDRGTDFQQYLESVRAAHRRKRNFIKLLDAAKWM